MTEYIKQTAILLSLILIVGACGETEKQLFNDKDAFFAFKNSSESLVEDDKEALEVPVYLSKSIAHGTVAYYIDVEGINNPAIEGVDFILANDSKTVLFEGDYIEYIEVLPIDNDEQDGAKQFRLVLDKAGADANVGMAYDKGTSVLVTINDNEHPLAEFFGTFDLTETTIEPGEYSYEVELSAHGDADKAILTGLWGIPQELALQFDYDLGTVAIMANQKYYGVDVGVPLDFTFYGWHWLNGEVGTSIKLEEEVSGTFDLETGIIEFPSGYLLQCSGPPGSPYIGSIWTFTMQDYCKMVKI